MTSKRILTPNESATDARLSPLCDAWGARVFSKVRLADVFPIDQSGLDSSLYSFALKSHFDFVVTDEDSQSLFSVEFDDSSHDSDEQKLRDQKKNLICKHFEFPLLRINSRYLQRKYGSMDLLGWFVHTWFAAKAMADAQAAGHIPLDEPIDPTFSFNMPGETGRFPLWLSRDVVSYIRRIANERGFLDPGISAMTGEDKSGTLHAIAYIRISDSAQVLAKTAMRAQNFPVDTVGLVEDISVREAYEKLSLFLDGDGTADNDVKKWIRDFKESYEVLTVSSWSRPNVG